MRDSVTTLENTAYVFTATDFGFTDPNSSPANNFLSVQITTLPTGGILTDNGIVLTAGDFVHVTHLDTGLLIYSPDANSGGTAYDTLEFKVRDDGGTDNSGANTDATARTMTIDVTMVNQAPIGEDNTVTTLENVPYTFTTSDFGFTDPNESSPNSLYAVKITSLPMFGVLTNNSVAVDAGDFISVSDISNGYLVFTPEANYWATSYDTFFFQVQDDGGTTGGGIDVDSLPKRMDVSVTWVNQAPVGTDNTVTAEEDVPYVLQAVDFGFTDPDELFSNWFDAVKITTLPSAGALMNDGVAVSANDFISLADILDGKLTFTAAANANGTAYTTIGFKVRDDGGTDNSGIDLDGTERTLTIDVTASNDAPVNSVPGTQGTDQNTSLVFSSTNGNAITVGDIDAGGADLEITLSATHGNLTLGGTTGLTFTVGDGTSDATMTFTGTISAINTALNGLTFDPTTSYQGYAAVNIVTDDQGNTGSGGALQDDDTIIVAVDAGSVAGVVWNDNDHDGIQDYGETGKSGVTVQLLDALGAWLASTTTDSSGHYSFGGLAAADYKVRVLLPTYYAFSPQDQGSDDTLDSDVDSGGYTDLFSVSLNQNRTDIAAGLFAEGSIGDG